MKHLTYSPNRKTLLMDGKKVYLSSVLPLNSISCLLFTIRTLLIDMNLFLENYVIMTGKLFFHSFRREKGKWQKDISY